MTPTLIRLFIQNTLHSTDVSVYGFTHSKLTDTRANYVWIVLKTVLEKQSEGPAFELLIVTGFSYNYFVVVGYSYIK